MQGLHSLNCEGEAFLGDRHATAKREYFGGKLALGFTLEELVEDLGEMDEGAPTVERGVLGEQGEDNRDSPQDGHRTGAAHRRQPMGERLEAEVLRLKHRQDLLCFERRHVPCLPEPA